jgi:hypothetical protein
LLGGFSVGVELSCFLLFEIFSSDETTACHAATAAKWDRTSFESYSGIATTDLAEAAAEAEERQFQTIECPKSWGEALAAQVGPGVWGAGDIELADEVDDPLAVRVLAGGSASAVGVLPLTVAPCGSVRFAMFVYGDGSQARLNWLVFGCEHKQRVMELCHVTGHTTITLADASAMGIPATAIEQMEGDLLAIPPDCACQAVSGMEQVVLVNWLRHCPSSFEFAVNRVIPQLRRDCVAPLLPIKVSLLFISFF